MNNNTQSKMIQKLVDGELSHNDRSQWMSGLTDGSETWRELALAFVEKQVIGEALEGIAEEVPKAFVAPKNQIEETGSQRRARTLIWLVGLTACLLAGVFIGAQYAAQNSDSVAVKQDINSQPLKQDLQEHDAAIGLADALSRSSSPVPNEFRRALLQAGYSLRDQQTIANVTLPTGGQVELPVRDVDVTYVGLKAFQ